MNSPTSAPRQPFVGLALAAAIGILGADFAPDNSAPLVLTLTIFAILALRCRHSAVVYLFVAAGFFLLHSFRVGDSANSKLVRELGEEPRPVTVCGRVESEPKLAASGSSSFLLKAKSIEIDGRTHPCCLKFLTRWRGAVDLGDEVNLFGTAEVAASPRNPGEFDLRSYLARQEIHRLLIVRYPENGLIIKHNKVDPIRQAARKTRDWMQTVLSQDLENAPDVTGAISGMILGLRHQTLDDIEEPFQQTGTLHLFAVAGLHVGIIARLLWIIATVIRLPRTWATALIIPALLFYSAVTGLHISSVRAAVMTSALLAGFFAERKVLPLNSLAAAAVIILCWNTNELFSVGFQLSFSVVTTLLLLADPAYRFLRRCFAPDPFMPRTLFGPGDRIRSHFTSWLARASSISFAAWVGSLPLMIIHYSLVTPVSLVANLVVVPIAFFVLAGGLTSIICAPLGRSLSVVFNNTNWLLTKIILGSVQLLGQIPGSHWYVDRSPVPSDVKLEINVLDLKSGSAIHIRTRQSDWLCDAGSTHEYQRVIRQYLRFRGVDRFNGLILTHGSAAHMGGAIGVLHDFSPRQLIDAAVPDRSRVHRQLIAQLAEEKYPRRVCTEGDELEFAPDVRAKILFPPRGFQATRADDQALVLRLDVLGKPKALLMSDSGPATENLLLQRYPDLRCAILVKGQHHSGVSASPRFLDSVRPQAVVTTSREFPITEQLDEEWLESLRARRIQLFRQDETGMVQIRIFRNRWELKSFVTGQTFCRTNE